MTQNDVAGPPDPSHDDVSNSSADNRSAMPEFDNESHDRDDDGPDGSAARADQRRAPEDKITGKPLSDMQPPGQDEALGSE